MKKITIYIVCAVYVLMFVSCTSNNALPPDKNAFLDFFTNSKFSNSIIHETADVEQWKSEENRPLFIYHLLTDVCAYYQDTNQIDASYEDSFNGAVRYFKPNEIDSISQDLLGFDIRLLDISVDESDENAKIYEVGYPDYDLSIATPSGIIISTPKTETYNYDGNTITIQADLFFKDPSTQTEYNCTMEYRFLYMPENTHIPYRFESCKIIDGQFLS